MAVGRPRREMDAIGASMGGSGGLYAALSEMRALGMGSTRIARALQRETGVTVAPMTVRRWLKETEEQDDRDTDPE